MSVNAGVFNVVFRLSAVRIMAYAYVLVHVNVAADIRIDGVDLLLSMNPN